MGIDALAGQRIDRPQKSLKPILSVPSQTCDQRRYDDKVAVVVTTMERRAVADPKLDYESDPAPSEVSRQIHGHLDDRSPKVPKSLTRAGKAVPIGL